MIVMFMETNPQCKTTALSLVKLYADAKNPSLSIKRLLWLINLDKGPKI